jgi:hypothetical protein
VNILTDKVTMETNESNAATGTTMVGRPPRKIPRGAQVKVKTETGYSKGFISEVANGKAPATDDARKVAAALARRMKPRVPGREAFPEYFGHGG